MNEIFVEDTTFKVPLLLGIASNTILIIYTSYEQYRLDELIHRYGEDDESDWEK